MSVLRVVAFLPEGSEWVEAPPSAWDVMLTPESQREVSEPLQQWLAEMMTIINNDELHPPTRCAR